MATVALLAGVAGMLSLTGTKRIWNRWRRLGESPARWVGQRLGRG